MSTDSETEPAVERPRRAASVLRFRLLVVGLLLLGALWSISGLDIGWDRLRAAPGQAWAIVELMYPIDVTGGWPPISCESCVDAYHEEVDRGMRDLVLDSIYIAWVGTLIGAVISLPLAFMAADNVAPRWLRIPVRQLFNAIRAVPELIVAVIFVAVTGLGPWAGALALGLHSVGTLGKLSTEAIETSDRGPIEAADAVGGRWISRMRWGVLPQVLPSISAFWLFRFEINVRASAVLGMIGAGGIGSELISQLRFRNFPEVGVILAVTVVVVLIIDTLSGAVRQRIIAGGGRKPDDPGRGAETMADLTGIEVG